MKIPTPFLHSAYTECFSGRFSQLNSDIIDGTQARVNHEIQIEASSLKTTEGMFPTSDPRSSFSKIRCLISNSGSQLQF